MPLQEDVSGTCKHQKYGYMFSTKKDKSFTWVDQEVKNSLNGLNHCGIIKHPTKCQVNMKNCVNEWMYRLLYSYTCYCVDADDQINCLSFMISLPIYFSHINQTQHYF